MVWACFWFIEGKIRRSELYLLNRDFKSKKHGYFARSYLEVLDDQMPNDKTPPLSCRTLTLLLIKLTRYAELKGN
jgi:hypothetical protein